MYDGASIPVYLEKIFVIELVCNFDLQNYPFDSQFCELTIVLNDVSDDFVILIPRKVDYTGNRKLSEYQVSTIRSNNIVKDGFSGQQIIIEFENMYLYYITSTYVPTFLLMNVSYLTFWYELEDFSNRIMVSLTSLLASELQPTSYFFSY